MECRNGVYFGRKKGKKGMIKSLCEGVVVCSFSFLFCEVSKV